MIPAVVSPWGAVLLLAYGLAMLLTGAWLAWLARRVNRGPAPVVGPEATRAELDQQVRALAGSAARLAAVVIKLPRCDGCGALAAVEPVPFARDSHRHACMAHRDLTSGFRVQTRLPWGASVGELHPGDLDLERFTISAGAVEVKRDLKACYRRAARESAPRSGEAAPSSTRRRVEHDHPVLSAIARAPVRPGAVSEAEREAVTAAAAGPWIPHEAVMGELEARRAREAVTKRRPGG